MQSQNLNVKEQYLQTRGTIAHPFLHNSQCYLFDTHASEMILELLQHYYPSQPVVSRIPMHLLKSLYKDHLLKFRSTAEQRRELPFMKYSSHNVATAVSFIASCLRGQPNDLIIDFAV